MSEENSKIDTFSPTLEGPRPARLEEREELIAMINLIFRTSVGRPPTIETDWAHVYAPHNLANVAVVCDVSAPNAPQLVASTGVWVCDVEIGEARLRVGGINCVGTLPDYRRHGLGAQVMAAAHQTMRERGCHVAILSTGISNWYRSMGWVEAGKTRDYRLNRANISLLPALSNNFRVVIKKLQVQPPKNRPNTQTNAPGSNFAAINDAVLQLHNQQRMGAPRTLDSFRQLAAARRADRIALLLPSDQDAEKSGVRAYLLLRENVVMEWAGEAADVLALVCATYETLDDPAASTTSRQSDPEQLLLRRLLLQTPGWQQPITEMLDDVGIPYNGDFLGMLFVVDPQAIVDAYGLAELDISIVEISEAGTTAGESRFRVTHRQESIEVDRRQLTKLLFGPERISPLAAEHLPLRFWQWGLEMV